MENKKQNEFIKIYNKCHNEFIRYCSVLAYGKMDSEDLVQEALFSAYKNFDKLKEQDKLLHYLIKAAKNISIGQQRKAQHQLRFINQHNQRLTENGALPEVLTDISFLYEAIAKLPIHQGEALILFEVSGFSMKEIAEIQGSTEEAIRAKICRGRKKLRALLQEEPARDKKSIEKRNLILLLMTMEEKEDDLFKSLRDAPTELSKEDVEKIIKGFPDLPPTPPESDMQGWQQNLFNKINLNNILFINTLIVLAIFIRFIVPENPVEPVSIPDQSPVVEKDTFAESNILAKLMPKKNREDSSNIKGVSPVNVAEEKVIERKNEEEKTATPEIEIHSGLTETVGSEDTIISQEKPVPDRLTKSEDVVILDIGSPLASLDIPVDKNKVYQSIEEALKMPGQVYKLDLSNQNLTAVPGYVEQFINLEELYLNGNQLGAIPEFISQLSNLQKLHLYNNKLTKLPESVGKLSKLTSLNLKENQLTKLPASIGQLSNLIALYLHNNKLVEMPESVGHFSSLNYLSLEGNELRSIPESIGRLSTLVYLKLGNNQLTMFPESILQLSNLKELHLEENQLLELPESIGKLAKLKILNLRQNNLRSIPESIGQLSNLTYLELGANQLTNLPESIGDLSNLRELYLGTLSVFAGDVLNLFTRGVEGSQLMKFSMKEMLYLKSSKGNQLTNLPTSIGQLFSLTHLGLGENKLARLPESIGQLSNLVYLSLGNNQLTSLPASIGQLSNLTHLGLRSNRLAELPVSIGQLSKLTHLGVRSNQLRILPTSIGQLSSLVHLGLGGNQLTRIPRSISRLSNLTELGLNGNYIMDIPRFLRKLSNLKNLHLSYNQLTSMEIMTARKMLPGCNVKFVEKQKRVKNKKQKK